MTEPDLRETLLRLERKVDTVISLAYDAHLHLRLRPSLRQGWAGLRHPWPLVWLRLLLGPSIGANSASDQADKMTRPPTEAAPHVRFNHIRGA
jgi:hypothetical protein